MKRKLQSYVQGNSRKSRVNPGLPRKVTLFKVPTRRKGYLRTGGMFNRPESKFFDTSISTTFDTTGEVLNGSLLLMAQGSSEIQRDGNKIVVTSINMKGTITPLVGALNGDCIQLVLVQDQQCNGATAAYTDIWLTNAFNSFLQLANSKRFKILKTFRKTISPTGINVAGTSVIQQAYHIKFAKKCKIPILFGTGGGGAVTDLRSNNLAWYGIAAFQDDQSTITMTTRVRFEG